MKTKHFVFYEIYNHDYGCITIFESWENLIKWKEDNKIDPNGYKDWGLKLITTSETEIEYNYSEQNEDESVRKDEES